MVVVVAVASLLALPVLHQIGRGVMEAWVLVIQQVVQVGRIVALPVQQSIFVLDWMMHATWLAG